MTQELVQSVNKQVANWMVLYMKLHHYHWFVKGHHFFTLHAKFEELYDEANGHIDSLAERVLSIGGKPVSTLKECLELSTIKEAAGSETEVDMVREIYGDFEKIIPELQTTMKLAEDSNDQGTSDMLLSIMGSLHKHVWMLKAYLG